MWCCPACGSGTRGTRDSDGALSIENAKKWKCFSCNVGGDVFDLVGYLLDIEDKREQLEAVARMEGITFNDTDRGYTKAAQGTEKSPEPEDYTEGRRKERDYILRCRANIEDPEAISYLAARGITLDDARTFGLGYDPRHKHGWEDGQGRFVNGGRIVFPWKGSDYYHIDRAASDDVSDRKYVKPRSDDVGRQPLYNPEAFNHDVVFIVEGVLDALSIEHCSPGTVYQAVALGSTGSRQFVEAAKARRYSGTVVIVPDNDEAAGRRAADELASALDDAGIAHMEINVPYGKDAADSWKHDRAELASTIGRAYEKAVLFGTEALDPYDVVSGIYEGRYHSTPVSTGIGKLDDAMNGGMRNGQLHILGAVSSLGKTTLTVQVADTIAASGRPVLFVTIEQSRQEIVSKSIARLMYIHGGHTATTWEIMEGYMSTGFDDSKREAFQRACEVYTHDIAPHMRILEASKQPSVGDIREIAEKIERCHGVPPVVFVDYLQLLAPQDPRDTDKRIVDRNITSLRQLARDMNTPVFVISSLNRSSYSGMISLDSYKESGAIEYGADVLLGLQPADMAERLEGMAEGKAKQAADKAIRENKAAAERECELLILKQRSGRTPEEGVRLTFKAASALFLESGWTATKKTGKRV